MTRLKRKVNGEVVIVDDAPKVRKPSLVSQSVIDASDKLLAETMEKVNADPKLRAIYDKTRKEAQASIDRHKKLHRKKSARTLRIGTLDTLFSEAIRLRDGFTCQKCGHQNKSAQAAHIWTRNNYSTRWDMENAMCLCYMCHIKGFHSAHREPAEFLEWVHQRMGDKRWEALKARSMSTVMVDKTYMDETEERLREYIKTLT